MKKKLNILIIGGSGHVSGAIVRCALANKDSVYTVTRGMLALPDGVISLIADRNDTEAMKNIISEQNMIWDLVIDCICYKPEDMLQDIELFKTRAKQFVMISTDFVYHPQYRKFPQSEDDAHYVITEDVRDTECVENPFLYGANKRICEKMLIDGKMGDVKWTVLRPCHIYGPTSELGCLPSHSRDSDLIEKIRAGKQITLVGGGYFLQQPILADDLAKTALSVCNNEKAYNNIFNTAGPDIIESWQYYKIIADIIGCDISIKEIPVDKFLRENPDATSFMCHRIYDLKALKDANFAVPSTSIKNGLRLHVDGLLKRRG